MSIFKKKNKKASPIRMPKGTPKATTPIRKRRFQPLSIFKKKKTKYPIRRKNRKVSKYLALPIVFLILISLVYLSIDFVLEIRENAYGEIEYEESLVLGLDNIPAYGGSEFLFNNNLEDSVVKDFLSNGNSAYRLPPGTSTEEIEEFYLEQLETLGWELVQTVQLGTPDRKYGQYWVKDGKGLRIYSKYNDIWYESISQEDAETALAQLVTEEIEREMLMASSEKQDLLPDYPWNIQIPKEYIIKYSPTDMKDLRAVSFQKMGSDEIVEIYPIGYWKAKELDYFILDYCNLKSTEENKYGVSNSITVSFRDTLGLKSTIQHSGGLITAYTIPNTYNSVVYVISSNNQENPLLQYIIENIKPMGSLE